MTDAAIHHNCRRTRGRSWSLLDPDDAWGHKPAHPVAGTVNGMAVRAVIETLDERSAILLGRSAGLRHAGR